MSVRSDPFEKWIEKQEPELFIGMEETNIHEFVSPCCQVGLSLEPLCRVACGGCGKTVKHEDAVYVGK